MRSIYVTSFLLILSKSIYSQGCCSGGSGSPIAGGASQGVLLDRQIEIAANYQYNSTNKFFVRDHDTLPTIDNLNSNYTYLRVAYGVTKNFTMSVESGYYINKTLIGLNKRDTIASSGIGDLILFPRYDVYNQTTEKFLPSETALMIPKTSDGRVLFAIPWHDKTLLGTTDTPIKKAELEPQAFQAEIEFVLETAKHYLAKPPTQADILSVFVGSRPLVKSGNTKNTAKL